VLNIELARSVIMDADLLPAEDRRAVEESKDDNGVDESVAEQFSARDSRAGGQPPNLDELARMVAVTIDTALALLAYCSNEAQIQYVRDRAILLGARYGGKQKININALDLAPRLERVFAEIAARRGLHVVGSNDRRMLRKKIRAALGIIQDSLNHKKTR